MKAETYQRQQQELFAAAHTEVTQIKTTIQDIWDEVEQHTHEISAQMDQFRSQIATIEVPNGTDIDRTMELAKLEAYDHRVQTELQRGAELLIQTMLSGVTLKLSHTLWNLKIELQQAIAKRNDLQMRIKQQEENKPLKLENLLKINKIEDLGNVITTTIKICHHP